MADLTHTDVDRRVEAVQMVSQQEGKRAVTALLEVLTKDRSPVVRQEVVDVIFRREDPRVIPAVIRVLREDDQAALRGRVAQVLGRCRHPDVFPALTLAAGNDREVSVRKEAVAAFGQLKDGRVLRALQRVLAVEREPVVRREAVVALAATGQGEAIPVLAEAMARDESVWVRREAVEGLVKMSSPIVPRTLVRALKTETDKGVVQSLIKGLAGFQGSETTAELVRVLKSGKHPEMTLHILHMLAAQKDPSLMPVFEGLLGPEQEAMVRKVAVGGISQIDDPRTVDVLCRVMESAQELWLRESVLLALSRMTSNVRALTVALTLSMREKEGVPLMDDVDAGPRSSRPPSRPLLERNAPRAATPEERERTAIRVDAGHSLGMLVYIRMGVVNHIRKSQDVRFIPVLSAAVKEEPEAMVREMMAVALGRLGDASCLPALVHLLQTEQEPLVREQAAVAIGRIQDPQVIPLLKGLLTDAQVQVQLAARQALEARGILSTDLFTPQDNKK